MQWASAAAAMDAEAAPVDGDVGGDECSDGAMNGFFGGDDCGEDDADWLTPDWSIH